MRFIAKTAIVSSMLKCVMGYLTALMGVMRLHNCVKWSLAINLTWSVHVETVDSDLRKKMMLKFAMVQSQIQNTYSFSAFLVP